MTAPQSRQPGKNFWTTPRLALTFVALALLAAFGISSCGGAPKGGTGNTSATGPAASNANKPSVTVSRQSAPAPAPPTEPMILPASLLGATFKDIDGKSLKLSDYSGKVLIVNMWATWCQPCRQETPELVKLHKDYKSRGLEVIGLATEQNDADLEAVKDFVKEQKVDYKVVYDDGSLAGPLVQMTRGRSVIPQSFIISRDGHIIGHFEGYSPVSTPPKLREAVEKAL
ncbi:MAG TPA: TlpA disulfide reductase family protein [Pyrinomonadaceae bacterium]|nr:TlpA disulfide reductase family protein [Pyrinomonadaceae bacterium]